MSGEPETCSTGFFCPPRRTRGWTAQVEETEEKWAPAAVDDSPVEADAAAVPAGSEAGAEGDREESRSYSPDADAEGPRAAGSRSAGTGGGDGGGSDASSEALSAAGSPRSAPPPCARARLSVASASGSDSVGSARWW